MRLMCNLELNESKLINDVLYTKKDFTTEDFQYYNENHCSCYWQRYRHLFVIEMNFRGYTYQTIPCSYNKDIYEIIGIKENRENITEIEYYFRPSKCVFDFVSYDIILRIGNYLNNWEEIWAYTDLCKTTLLLRKDFQFALKARKAYIRHRKEINNINLPIYPNDVVPCLDDSYILERISHNSATTSEIWAVHHPWIDYKMKLTSISPVIKEVSYSLRQWCIFPFGGVGLVKVCNKQRERMKISLTKQVVHSLTKQEKVVRLQYVKAFREKLCVQEEDYSPWLKRLLLLKRRLRNKQRQKRVKRLRNGKLF